MAVRRGYFPIDAYPFSSKVRESVLDGLIDKSALERRGESALELRFEETLRVHTKTGKVWDFRPGDSNAIGFWAVTEDEVEWTLYHLPDKVYVLERDEEIESKEEIVGSTKVYRWTIHAEQLSPRDAAQWLVKWDYPLPDELKYLEKEVIGTAPPGAPLAEPPAHSHDKPILRARELLDQFQEKWAKYPPSGVHLAALDRPKYGPILDSFNPPPLVGRQVLFFVPPGAQTYALPPEFPEWARQAPIKIDLGGGQLLMKGEVSDHQFLLLSTGAEALSAGKDFEALARQAGAVVSAVTNASAPTPKEKRLCCYDDPIMFWIGYLFWKLGDTGFVSRKADYWWIENAFAASVEMLKRFLASEGREQHADAAVVAKAAGESARASKPQANQSPNTPKHSDDFRSVSWNGEDYSFSATQAACVKVLWEAWQNGTPDLAQETILDRAGSEGKRLQHLFKDHRAWKRIIVPGATKGAYRLTDPPSK